MRNLPAPTVNSFSYFMKISKEKNSPNGKLLTLAQKAVSSAYAQYIDGSNLDSVVPYKPLPKTRIKALLHAYNVHTASMKEFRGLLLKPKIKGFSECPFCGINEPKTLDHYLPKESYPEFSVHSLNLLPVCSVCNSNYKKRQFKNVGGGRIFIHSYFDIIPKFAFIKVDVKVLDKVFLEFTPVITPLHKEFSELFSRHFNGLGLAERFALKSSAEIIRLRPAMIRFYASGGWSLVSQELEKEMNDHRQELKDNHWRVALLGALSSSKDFCDQGFLKEVHEKV